jgi:CheY-like chemotaxis protein
LRTGRPGEGKIVSVPRISTKGRSVMEPRKVLVVDDNEDVLEVMKHLLIELGAEAVTAHGGKEGIDAALEHKPDLILLDLMMPDMPGEEVAAALRENTETGEIPIVFLTGLASEEDTKKRPSAGYRFLSKHLPPDEIMKEIEDILA